MSSDLAPGFLLASPPLGDPHFDRTVVLLAAHGSHGALGLVVNRVAPFGLGRFFELAGFPGIDSDAPVYLGGPVETSSGWIVTDDPDVATPTILGDGRGIDLGDGLHLTSSRAAFEALARRLRTKPVGARTLVALGYSGWGPEQLEGEIRRGAWLPLSLTDDVLFRAPVPERWERGYAALGLSPAFGIAMRGGGEA